MNHVDHEGGSRIEQDESVFFLALKVGVEFSPMLVAMVLLYVNQIMGYLSKSGLEEGHSLIEIVEDVSTPQMFVMALIGGVIAQLGYEVVKDR